MKQRIFFLVSLLALAVIAGCAGGEEQKKPVPDENPAKFSTLLAEAADSPHPDGCVSCHKKTEEVDRSLPAYVKRISGHPEVKGSSVGDCYECHEAQKNYNLYKVFFRGMHKSHWESETFYQKSEGRCYSCHTVEKNGVSGIKDYPLAGYREGVAGQPAKKAKPAPKQRQAKPEEQREQPGQQEQQQDKPEAAQPEEEVEPQPTPTP